MSIEKIPSHQSSDITNIFRKVNELVDALNALVADQTQAPNPESKGRCLMGLQDAILATVLEDLCDRSGFDHWWHTIDDDTKEELQKELTDKIGAVLDKHGISQDPV